jgi:urease accessory protein
MVAVGLFAASLGRRALWAVPCTFVGLMMVGGALGMLAVPLPYVELGIGLSVVILGLAVAIRWPWPVAAAMAMVGVLAIFHGHSHGAEMPGSASGLTYAAGFVAATGLLHLVGIGLGLGVAKAGIHARRVMQAGGAVLALTGLVLLTGAV